MAITDKTRKLLWGQSSARCAICKCSLVIDKTPLDAESIVGQECHIHSGSPNGFRHNPSLSSELVDDISNLLLLCNVHHKMVDDQVSTYTADDLRKIKAEHETWVKSKLQDEQKEKPIRFKRFKNEIPTKLDVMLTGNEVLKLTSSCYAYYPSYPEGLSNEEVEIVGGFVQDLTDWSELADGLEPIEYLRATKTLDDALKNLLSNGFVVFGARERQRLTGGTTDDSDWWVAHISVLRITDPNILIPEALSQALQQAATAEHPLRECTRSTSDAGQSGALKSEPPSQSPQNSTKA